MVGNSDLAHPPEALQVQRDQVYAQEVSGLEGFIVI